MTRLANLPADIKQYLIVTGNYWAFTLTDGIENVGGTAFSCAWLLAFEYCHAVFVL